MAEIAWCGGCLRLLHWCVHWNRKYGPGGEYPSPGRGEARSEAGTSCAVGEVSEVSVAVLPLLGWDGMGREWSFSGFEDLHTIFSLGVGKLELGELVTVVWCWRISYWARIVK